MKHLASIIKAKNKNLTTEKNRNSSVIIDLYSTVLKIIPSYQVVIHPHLLSTTKKQASNLRSCHVQN